MDVHTFRHRRKGFAVVIVLALLSVTLALSYSMMRVQSTTSQIQQNMSRQADARQAAISGVSAGVREMYEGDWGGVDSTLQMNLGNNCSYQVNYETGDAWLESDDPDYAELPFRVTVISTGYAFDSANPTVRSEYKIRAVVQLVRRKLQSNPSGYAAAAGHSMYSFGTGTNTLEAPNQVHGKTFINGKLDLCEDWQKTNRPFHGLIDEIAIYDRDMSNSELASVVAAGNSNNANTANSFSTTGIRHWWRFNETDSSATVATDSAGSLNGSYMGGVYPGIDVGGGNKAVYLDGVSGRVDLGNMALPNPYNFTIMARVMPMTLTGNNEDGRIFSKAWHTNSSSHEWMLSTTRNGSFSYPRIRLKTSTNFYERVPNSGSLSTYSWIHLAITFNSSTNQAKLYVNGTQRDMWTAYGIPQSSSDILAWIGDNPPGSARSRYLEATKSLADSDQGDYRPLAGDVTLSSDRNELSTALTAKRQLGCDLLYQATSASSVTASTISGTTYRLYPGGKEYTIPTVSSTVSYQTLEPDSATNPLGIFRCAGTVSLENQASIRGTLIAQNSGSDIRLRGNEITISGVDLPAIDGDATVYQLPTLIASDDVAASYDVNATIEGAIAAIGDLEIENLYSDSTFQLTGQAYCDEFKLHARSEWAYVAYYSSYYLYNFVNYMGHANTSANFASWLDNTSYAKFENNVRIELPETSPTYQWLDLSQPIYQKGDDDTGLVWELVRWKDEGGI